MPVLVQKVEQVCFPVSTHSRQGLFFSYWTAATIAQTKRATKPTKEGIQTSFTNLSDVIAIMNESMNESIARELNTRPTGPYT